MEIRILRDATETALYDTWLSAHPQATLWQSPAWKGYQEALGRKARIYAAFRKDEILAAALVIIDHTAFGLSTWDLPRGPLWAPTVEPKELIEFLTFIEEDAKKDKCISLFFSPVVPMPAKHEDQRQSSRHEQPEASVIIDILRPEDEIMAHMHHKGRYNVRLAEKHGVTVEESTDIGAWHSLLKQTASRDGFGILPKRNYELFLERIPGSFLLIAKRSDGKAIGGLIGVAWGDTGIYYYGASSYADRPLMAPYLLQWAAIRRCKTAGCTRYDLLGIAPENQPNHPWNSISDFKRKFGGMVVTYPVEQHILLQPLIGSLLAWKRRVIG